MAIHPSAVIEKGAQIDPSATVGPLCVVGPQVVLGAGVVLKSHVVVTGETTVGEGTVIFPFAVIGEIPQDLKFKGEASRLDIGKRNRIREHVTMNCGTEGGGGITRVGDDNLFMAGCHIAHDAIVGNNVVVVNNAAVAGHCVIEDEVLNLVGLKRRGVSRGDITALRAAFQMLAQGEGTFHDRAERLGAETESAYVREIVEFVLADSGRHFLTPK